jgi:glycosyltransferase involved in cell wall biosynthesis
VNILLTNYLETLSPGGINKVVAELGKHLAENGHAVTILQGNPQRRRTEETHDGFRIVRIGSPIERYLTYFFNGKLFFHLKKHLKELNPHVVHIHGHTLFSAEALYAVKRFDRSIPIVLNYHVDAFSGTVGRRYFWNAYTKIAQNMAKTATHVVADSDFEADYVSSVFSVRSDKLSVIAPGVDPVFCRRSLMLDKSERQKTLKLLFVGYLIKRKNVQAILHTLFELVHTVGIKEARLTIVGVGPDKAALLRLAEELDILENITWKEALSMQDLVFELSEADVFLLLSKSEAYGITVSEALSVGTPCIVTNTTALREFTEELGCFGVETPPDPHGVAQLILHICENEVRVGPLSNKIRSWKQVAQDYEAVYQRVSKG